MTFDDQLHLCRAEPTQAEAIHALLAVAGKDLARRGFRNWDPPYALDRVRADIEAREVYAVYRNGELVASYTLALEPSRPYEPESWSTPGAKALYLNRLVVDPTEQGRGIGGWCLAQVVKRAQALNAVAVRCDVLFANSALCAFYERHHYTMRGERSHSGWRFACYERLLDDVRASSLG